jgi:hypothetical protein
MNTPTKPEKAKNYSVAQEQRIRDLAPLDYEIAKILAVEFDKSAQSVVSKCKSMDVAYIVKAKPTKKVAKVTKAELVAAIENMIDRDLTGLEKGTSKALLNLGNGIAHLMPVKTEPELPELGDSAK